MQSAHSPEQLTYGIQLWKLNCLYFDGDNYRWNRHHRAVEPAERGKIAVAVNLALKRRFATPGELQEAARSEGNLLTMPSTLPPGSDLRRLLPRGAVVSTFAVVGSRSGLSSRLLVLAVVQGEIVSIAESVAAVLQLELHSGQVIVNGDRAAAGAHLVALLSRSLHGDPVALRHNAIAGGK